MRGLGNGFIENAFRVVRNVAPLLALTACDPKICEGPLSALPVERCNAVVMSRVNDCLDQFSTSGNGGPRTTDQCLDDVREGLQEQADDLQQDCANDSTLYSIYGPGECRDDIMKCLYGDPKLSPTVSTCVQRQRKSISPSLGQGMQ